MSKVKIVSMFLLGSLTVAGDARSQQPEPRPPYGGNDGAQAEDTAEDDDSAAASVDYFHDQLAPFGQWVTREGYGVVWVPQVSPGWRPYTTGHWANTDDGFAWVADESWGWAPFHYGRWYYDRGLGWSWLPGSTWAPAWVSWQSGGGYLGWAPLPPAVAFRAAVGLGAAATLSITPGFYTFVREKDFLAPRVAHVIVPSVRNVAIVRNTTNITSYAVVNNRIVNAGLNVKRIEQATGHPVPKVQVSSLSEALADGRKGAFYQLPVITKSTQATHAEFGAALPRQVASQQKSRSYAQVFEHSAQNRRSAATTSSSPHGHADTTTGKTHQPTASSGQPGSAAGRGFSASPSSRQPADKRQAGSQPGRSASPEPRHQPSSAASVHHVKPPQNVAPPPYRSEPHPQPKPPPPPPQPAPKH
jgi:hypothetical protein